MSVPGRPCLRVAGQHSDGVFGTASIARLLSSDAKGHRGRCNTGAMTASAYPLPVGQLICRCLLAVSLTLVDDCLCRG
jgi:hypothetical protein